MEKLYTDNIDKLSKFIELIDIGIEKGLRNNEDVESLFDIRGEVLNNILSLNKQKKKYIMWDEYSKNINKKSL